MRNACLFLLVVVACACSSNAPTPDHGLFEVSSEFKSECQSLGIVNRRSAGSEQESFNTQSAMELAFEDVLARGGNSYHVLNVDTGGRGTQVIVEALDCA